MHGIRLNADGVLTNTQYFLGQGMLCVVWMYRYGDMAGRSCHPITVGKEGTDCL